MALQAAKEIRENLKVIGRITGEIPLDPVLPAAAETGGLLRAKRKAGEKLAEMARDGARVSGRL